MCWCMQELGVTWSQMEFDHEVHQRTGIQLICASEELIDVLEENQVKDYYMYKLYNTTLKVNSSYSKLCTTKVMMAMFHLARWGKEAGGMSCQCIPR